MERERLENLVKQCTLKRTLEKKLQYELKNNPENKEILNVLINEYLIFSFLVFENNNLGFKVY